jgi:CRISPR-associated protein Csm5
MTDRFMTRIPIALTTLSPLHVGCGEDYEPTNFVADRKSRRLYHFDPSVVKLNRARLNDLLRVVQQSTSSIRDIYAFYEKNEALYKPFATGLVPYDSNFDAPLASLTQGALIKNSSVQRTCYQFIGGADAPYVPGSSIKGAIHTALLNRVAMDSKAQPLGRRDWSKIDGELLGGTMDGSPMRFLSVEDFHADGKQNLSRRIVLVTRPHRRDGATEVTDQKFKAYFEVTELGLYRALQGAIAVKHTVPRDFPRPDLVYKDVGTVFRDLNRYSLAEFKKEWPFWGRGHGETLTWMRDVKALIDALEPEFQAGRMALVRIGKNSGASNFTLQPEGWAKIESRGAKGQPSQTLPEARTIPVAHYRTPKGNIVLPFGWVILEPAESRPNEKLQAWCWKSFSAVGGQDLGALYEKLKSEKAAIIEQWNADRAALEAEEKARQEKEAEEAKQAEALAQMSEEQRSIEVLMQKVRSQAKIMPGSQLCGEVAALIQTAGGWEAQYKKMLAAQLAKVAKGKGLYDGKPGKNLKNFVRENGA